MNNHHHRSKGGDTLGARLEIALAEGKRLRSEHRDTCARLHQSVDSLNRFIFTKSDAGDGVAPYPGCSQPASPAA